jgi:AcrR family transcriptional regulator
MASAAVTSRRPRRPRHDPRESEREILAAAEELLRERPFREITVEAIMGRTGLKRPAFYAHFRDRYDVVLRVVEQLQEALFGMANRWLQGSEPESDARAALDGIVGIYETHGPVLQALADAATSDARVQEAYRALVQAFVDATAEHIRAEQALGRTAVEVDPQETAHALVLLNERYLAEVFGRARPTDLDRSRVVGVLTHIFLATLYGGAAAAAAGAGVGPP